MRRFTLLRSPAVTGFDGTKFDFHEMGSYTLLEEGDGTTVDVTLDKVDKPNIHYTWVVAFQITMPNGAPTQQPVGMKTEEASQLAFRGPDATPSRVRAGDSVKVEVNHLQTVNPVPTSEHKRLLPAAPPANSRVFLAHPPHPPLLPVQPPCSSTPAVRPPTSRLGPARPLQWPTASGPIQASAGAGRAQGCLQCSAVGAAVPACRSRADRLTRAALRLPQARW